MRLQRLDLAPYGRFGKKSLAFTPEASLHVVLGRNEAGKSTTLSAFKDFLFGFPHETDYGFLHVQQTLRVGCRIALASGETFEAWRRKGKQKTLIDASGDPVSDEPLLRALGAIDRATFETEFGLDQVGLREGGEALLQAGGSLAEALAAGSSTLGALNRLKRELREQGDASFTPTRSKNKPFYLALDAYTQASRRLREASVTGDELKAAEEANLLAAARISDLNSQHSDILRAIGKRQRARRVGEKLRRLDDLAAELAGMTDLPVTSPETVSRARAALEAERNARAEAERLATEEIEENALRATLGLDPALLAQGEAIEALREDLGNMREKAEQLPRRVEAFESARTQLDELARRLGRDGHSSLLTGTPDDAALARLRSLVARRRDNQRSSREAEGRHAAAAAELREAQEGEEGPALDLAPRKRRLDGFADVARDAERLTQENAALAEEDRAQADVLATFDPPVADLDALARLPLPDMAALTTAAQAETAAQESLRSAREAAGAARRAEAASAQDLKRREAASPGATRGDWEAARQAREAAFDRLGAALDGPPDLRAERFETVRARALAADAAGEGVLAHADQAAQLQAARDARDACLADALAAEALAAEAEAGRLNAVAASAALWSASGLAPRDVAAMTRWRDRAAALLERRARASERRAAAAALGARVAAAHEALNGWLAEAGAAPTGETFEEAMRKARTRLDALTETSRAAAERAARRLQAARMLANCQAERASADAEARVLEQDWGPATSGAGLRPDATVEEAEAALAVWAEASLPRRDYLDIGHRIETMKGDIARFAQAVDAAARAGAPAEVGAPAREALPRLVASLARARQADDERRRLDAAASRRAARRASLEAERQRVAAALGHARAALGVADDEGLALALERCDVRAQRLEEQVRARAGLAKDGDGLDEAALRAEAAAFDPAALAEEIAAAEREQATLLVALSAAGAASQGAATRHEALARGRDAAGAAIARVEAAADMRDAGERWLLRRAASRLAERAVERHRADAQNPLIERAGGYFALATAGGFVGLGVGFEDDRPILAARRDSGETVGVKGLSEGARDQLFLSLRLALLERRAGEPIPFVGDDLLASFDDERAARTLDLLAAFGAGRQSILFTHHARVAELAQQLQRNVEVLEI